MNGGVRKTPRMKDKELRKLARELVKNGWTIHPRGKRSNGHYYATHPLASRPVTLGYNPSNRFSMKALRGDLDRALGGGERSG